MTQQQATEHLTHYVADFICGTRMQDLPQDVVGLGKKSILDGLGLALSGGASHCGGLVRRHLADLNLGAGPATIIGTRLKVAPRFAAFANGVGIHADDYDDTQLAVATDRVDGLAPQPAARGLRGGRARGEATGASGAQAMLAYHLGVEVECK